MNRGEEDYIKAIYELDHQGQGIQEVSNLQLAQFFSHSAQSVNEMIKKLSKKKLVSYTPYKGSHLTQEGMEVATRLIRVHRIWETFLVEKLGYTWEEVHEEAEALEHMTSAKLEARMFTFLGEPHTCPHGNIIPPLHGQKVDKTPTVSLVNADQGKSYTLKRVVDRQELLAYLNRLEIRIGQSFQVIHVDTMSEIIEIGLDGKSLVIGFKIASQLFVEAK